MTLQHFSTQTGISNETSDTSEGMTKSLPESTGGLITSLHPLRIHSSPSEPPRSPTLRECGVIIRQLYNANSLQSQEVSDQILTSQFLPHMQTFQQYVFLSDSPHQGYSQGHHVQPENHPRELHYGQSLSRWWEKVLILSFLLCICTGSTIIINLISNLLNNCKRLLKGKSSSSSHTDTVRLVIYAYEWNLGQPE